MTPMTSFRVQYGPYLFYLLLWALLASLLIAGGMTFDMWQFWGAMVCTSAISTVRGYLRGPIPRDEK